MFWSFSTYWLIGNTSSAEYRMITIFSKFVVTFLRRISHLVSSSPNFQFQQNEIRITKLLVHWSTTHSRRADDSDKRKITLYSIASTWRMTVNLSDVFINILHQGHRRRISKKLKLKILLPPMYDVLSNSECQRKCCDK